MTHTEDISVDVGRVFTALLEAIPEAWIASIPDASEALTVADQLIHTFLYNAYRAIF